MESSLVIKVKYDDTLRRFNALVNENGQLDLDISGLRAKILGLFNFPVDADLTLTYVDEDGDVVTLVDDNDLLDVMKQRLKFLRVDVHLNNDDFGKSYAKSSSSSTPMRSPRVQNQLPNINTALADVLKSVPEPVRDALSKLSLDMASKAASSNCVVAEFMDCFSKMGQSILNPAQLSQVGASTSTQSEAKENPMASAVPPAANASMEKPKCPPVSAPVDLNLDPPTTDNFAATLNGDDRKETEKRNAVRLSRKSVGVSSNSNESARPVGFRGECPFSHMSVANDSSAQPYVLPRISRFFGRENDSTIGMFHRGVQCDGCGVHPITGPRYKSKVIDDYDLCSICFAQMGNEADYIKMDRPVSYCHPPSFNGLHDPNFWNARPPLLRTMRHCGRKPTRSKLDSRFILDVNVLDGTIMAPSTHFTKIWRMRNSGSVSWPQGARLVWIGGDRFSNEDSALLEIPVNGVPVDGELDVAVDFTSPDLPGRYISYWRMASPSGTKFGQRVWVLIQVDASKKDSNSDGGLNLNLPPDNSSGYAQIIDVNVQPAMDSGLLDPGNSNAAYVLENPVVDVEQSENQEMSFPINDTLFVGESVSGPTLSGASSSVLYPIIDLSEAPHVGLSESLPVTDDRTSSENVKGKETDEKSLLKKLVEMGFKQVDLNKEILRINEYNLEKSVDDLCSVCEWDAILEELQEMGFRDEEKNKMLLKKNNGSIKRVVMDLVSDENA